jgi:DNA-binding NarL/FixJ family response regulator
MVAEGLDMREIAQRLGYSRSTIKGVLSKLMIRIEARNRCHAVAIVVRDGLI